MDCLQKASVPPRRIDDHSVVPPSDEDNQNHKKTGPHEADLKTINYFLRL